MTPERKAALTIANGILKIGIEATGIYADARSVTVTIASLERDLTTLRDGYAEMLAATDNLLPRLAARRSALANAAESADPEVAKVLDDSADTLDKAMRALLAISEGAAA